MVKVDGTEQTVFAVSAIREEAEERARNDREDGTATQSGAAT